MSSSAGPQWRAFLGSLADGDRRALLESGRTRRWSPGEMLLREGDRADTAIVLLEGIVKIHRTSSEGIDVVLNLSGPGELLGEVAAVRDAARSANATALTTVQAVVLSIPRLREFLAGHPRATLALLELALARVQVSNTRRIEFATSESLARVASRLVELAERLGVPGAGGAIEVELPISQEDLASWSACSRESTARALRTLRDLKVIETHRLRLVVLDLARLRSHEARL